MSAEQTYSFASASISPDDPRLHTLETEHPVVLKSEHALTLLSLGLESKAYALETCGKRKRKKRCDRDHQHRETITCKQRMHWFCAGKLAIEHLERILTSRQFALLKASPGRPDGFQYIQLTVPCERHKRAVQRFSRRLGRKVRQLADGGFAPTWWNMPGFNGALLSTRMIYWGSYVSPERWRAAFPDAAVSVLTRDAVHLPEYLERLLAPMIPSTGEECAEQEAIFSGVRQFHAVDIHWDPSAPPLDAAAEGELFPTDPPGEGNNSPPHAHGGGKTGGDCCPDCGQPFTEYTDWLPIDATPEEIANVRWHRKRL